MSPNDRLPTEREIREREKKMRDLFRRAPGRPTKKQFHHRRAQRMRGK